MIPADASAIATQPLQFGDLRLPERFWDKVMPIPFPTFGLTGCWIWMGALTSRGYGSFNLGIDRNTGKQRTGVAHKLTFEVAWQGDIRRFAGDVRIVDDHECRVRACCNPDHLRRVDEPTNVACGMSPSALNGRKTCCPRGHEYDYANTLVYRGKRYCHACRRHGSIREQSPRPVFVNALEVG